MDAGSQLRGHMETVFEQWQQRHTKAEKWHQAREAVIITLFTLWSLTFLFRGFLFAFGFDLSFSANMVFIAALILLGAAFLALVSFQHHQKTTPDLTVGAISVKRFYGKAQMDDWYVFSRALKNFALTQGVIPVCAVVLDTAADGKTVSFMGQREKNGPLSTFLTDGRTVRPLGWMTTDNGLTPATDTS